MLKQMLKQMLGRTHCLSPGSEEDRSVSTLAANAYALSFVVPVGGALLGAFFALHGWRPLYAVTDAALERPLGPLFLFVVGVVGHEALHALTWRWLGQVPAHAVRLGFQWKSLTPYAHCSAPMPARLYRLSAAAPGVVLGLAPAAVGLAAGHGGLFLFGLLFTLAAGGDALTLWLLRGVPDKCLVQDHPSRAGCIVLGRNRASGGA